MLNLVVLVLFVTLAAAKPDYFNFASSFNPAQGVGPYNGGPVYGPAAAPAVGPANSQGGRDVSYTRTEVIHKRVRGRTTNFDPKDILRNAVPHSVKNAHYAEENIAHGPIGSRLQEAAQPQINYNSRQHQRQSVPRVTITSGGKGGRLLAQGKVRIQLEGDAQIREQNDEEENPEYHQPQRPIQRRPPLEGPNSSAYIPSNYYHNPHTYTY